MERHLGARPDHQPIILIPISDTGMRFKMSMLLLGRAIFTFENMLSGSKDSLNITYFSLYAVDDVVLGVVDVSRIRFVVNHRRAVLHGFFWIDDCR